MHFSVSGLDALLNSYGYWAVLVFVMIESTGIPFPGETMLIAASIYAGSTHHLSIVLIIVAAAAGAIIGDNLGYFVGREGGYRLLRRYGHYIRLDEAKLKLGQYLFLKHGGKVVFFGRFVSILRAWAAFLAGVDRMPWLRFFAFNAAGGILWAAIYGIGSYVLGNNINRFAGPVGIVIGVIAAIIIIAFLVFMWRNEKRLEAEAEKALPGPLEQYRSGTKPVKDPKTGKMLQGSKSKSNASDTSDTSDSQDGGDMPDASGATTQRHTSNASSSQITIRSHQQQVRDEEQQRPPSIPAR